LAVLLRRRLSVGAVQARLMGKAPPCRLMRMVTPPRFRHLLAAVCSIWKGTVAAVDLEGEQRGRGAEQRRDERRWQSSRGKRRRGGMNGGGMSGGERERALEGIRISHARRGTGTWAAWWAGPAHFLLLFSFSFFPFLFSSSSTALSCCFKFFLNSQGVASPHDLVA